MDLLDMSCGTMMADALSLMGTYYPQPLHSLIYLINLTRGGNSATDKITGKVSLVKDQTLRSPSCAALFSAWEAKEPIVLIAGTGYELLPFDIKPKEYVVLGYYAISHSWGLFWL
jgi:hypothetical protein